MAARMPQFPNHPLVPVTPPPEQVTFRKPAIPLNHLKRKATTEGPGIPPPPPQDRYSSPSKPNAHLPTPEPSSSASTATPTPTPAPSLGSAQAQVPRPNSASTPASAGLPPTIMPTAAVATPMPAASPAPATMTSPAASKTMPAVPAVPTMPPMPPMDATKTNPLGADPAQSLDPRYLAMASRIASFYHQRCQAISTAQQQRCQAWANMHRQKCQDTMQAAMLVVAWYVRDRIQRRRRKQKRSFKAGLRARGEQLSSQPRITRAESVRRWALEVPESAALAADVPAVPELVDRDEATFSMDREPPPPDKDGELYATADNLIRSQYRKVEVPMLGVLSFDVSDSDSDDGSEHDRRQQQPQPQEAPEQAPQYMDPEPWDMPALAAAAGFKQAREEQEKLQREKEMQKIKDEEVEYEDYDDGDDDDDDYDYEDDDFLDDDMEDLGGQAPSSRAGQIGTGTGTESRANKNNRSMSS